ncbi:hypothetical protein BH10BAC1_BH10BAC1_20850 [soil metagenome]
MIKTIKISSAMLLCSVLLLSTSSCFVSVSENNGHHKGWYKNSKNPHNPSTTNPGKSKGKGKK